VNLRPLIRLSWRNLRRLPLRHLVIVAMIGLPVAALTAGLVLIRAGQDEDRLTDRFRFGGGDLAVGASGRPVELPPELSGFPRQEVREGQWAVGDARRADLRSWREVSPALLETLPMVEGRPPSRPGEVMANRSGALGDLPLDWRTDPDLPSMAWKVVGWFDLPLAPDIVALPGTFPPSDAASWRQQGLDVPRHLALIRLGRPPTQGELAALTAADNVEVIPLYSAGGSTGLATELAAVAGSTVAFAWCGLLAASALAITARQRRREAALLATQGATPGVLRVRLLADAVLLGLVGAVGGLLVGLGLSWSADRWAASRWLGFPRVDLLTHTGPLVVVAPLLGLCSAAIAGWAVSRTALRRPPADQLSDPRPAAPGRLAILGVVTATVSATAAWWLSPGTASPAATAAGSVVMVAAGVVALVALSGALLRALPALVARRGPGVRIASRQLHRLGARATAAAGVLALTCAAALIVGMIGEWNTVSGEDRSDRPPDPPTPPAGAPLVLSASRSDVVIRDGRLVWMGELTSGEIAAIQDVFDGRATVVQRRIVVGTDLVICSGGRCEPVTFVDTAGWAAGLPEGVRNRLAAGEFVVLGASVGEAEVRAGGIGERASISDRVAIVADVTGAARTLLESMGWASTVVLVPEGRWGGVSQGRPVGSETLIAVPRDAALDATSVRSDLAALQRRGISFWSNEPTDLLPRPAELGRWLGAGVAAGSTVLGLLVLWMALGLLRQETRREEHTLIAQGATPRQRASIAAWRAALCTVAAAVPAAAVTTLVLTCLTRDVEDLVGAPPVAWYVAALIGAPLVAAAVFVPAGLGRLRGGPDDLGSLGV
jgi:hypothetical protein